MDPNRHHHIRELLEELLGATAMACASEYDEGNDPITANAYAALNQYIAVAYEGIHLDPRLLLLKLPDPPK